ncbi:MULTISPECIES: hypothetical protein [Microbacterium]|uniref:hypothetical protein n=1 Tax=Microbacterium TaxID=33882 RepID=UPI0014307A38|nr:MULTISPECIES: hypothetical protein [Microbacterium]MCK6067798.1 hypothetical protein [Microbacterium sp. EYE_512]
MYQLNATSLGVLATTGATVAQGWVSAWTLVVAGLALLSISRVVRVRQEKAAAAEE